MNDHDTSGEAAPMDLQTLWSLFGDDEETVREILETFAVDLEKNCEAMRDALTARDRKRFGRVAHSMKGASGNVGAETLAMLCSTVERRSQDATWEELEGFLVTVRRESDKLRNFLGIKLRGRLLA